MDPERNIRNAAEGNKSMEEEKTITVPLKLISDAVEQADENWNQYLDVEKMESTLFCPSIEI